MKRSTYFPISSVPRRRSLILRKRWNNKARSTQSFFHYPRARHVLQQIGSTTPIDDASSSREIGVFCRPKAPMTIWGFYHEGKTKWRHTNRYERSRSQSKDLRNLNGDFSENLALAIALNPQCDMGNRTLRSTNRYDDRHDVLPKHFKCQDSIFDESVVPIERNACPPLGE